VVRHELVQRIVSAYALHDEERETAAARAAAAAKGGGQPS
jgi:phosphate starvation-inducible protein PhoH